MQHSHAFFARLAVTFLALGTVHAADDPGASLYAQRCAGCHENATGRIPTRAALREVTPEAIVGTLTNGPMLFQASGMSLEEKRAVAMYLSAKPFGSPQQAQTHPNPCAKPARELRMSAQHWNGWGRDLGNTRYQPKPGLRAADVPRLKLKWAYAYAGRFAQGQPTLIGDRLFVSNTLGEVSSLDARTGCEHWTFQAATSVKVALVAGVVQLNGKAVNAMFFGDERSAIYAVNADTGEQLWKAVVNTHAVSRIVGAPVFHAGRLYVAVSSAEEAAARDPTYSCCTFRGNVVAMNAADGAVLWTAFVIPEEPKPLRVSSAGTPMFGPAGGGIWSSPTLDPKRGVLYVGTGNSYTDVATDGTNAVIAFDLQTGARRWIVQTTRGDNFVLGCRQGEGNCPTTMGPDFDFGASPILQTLRNGKQVLLAGQKSGVVHALDPDHAGQLLWRKAVGTGSALGGIEWGPAVDGDTIYVAIADAILREGGLPGLTALRLSDGQQRWSTPTPAAKCSWEGNCLRGQPGAVTVMPGIVFSGALDGHMRAYDARTGRIVWDFDTAPAIATINGPPTAGGSIDAAGPTLANGMLYVNSGYGRWNKAGRLLLAFSVDGE